MKKLLYILTGTLIGCIMGFFIGRKTIEHTESIKYVKGEEYKAYFTITSKPVEKFIPDNFKLADIEVPKDFYIPDSADLRPTVYDWNLERIYTQELFDNQYGKLTLEAKVQYNRLLSITPTFVPLEKHITKYREKVWQPFVFASYSTLNHAGVGGGMYYHDIGIGLRYTTDFKQKGLDVSLFYKF